MCGGAEDTSTVYTHPSSSPIVMRKSYLGFGRCPPFGSFSAAILSVWFCLSFVKLSDGIRREKSPRLLASHVRRFPGSMWFSGVTVYTVV